MFTLGVSGGSGSGKTTFLKLLQERLERIKVSVISQDDYYLPVDRSKDNHKVDFDCPEAVDLDALFSDLALLRNGEVVKREEYTFNNKDSESKVKTIEPASIVIVEGLFVFYDERIRTQCDHLVFIDADTQVRLERRLERDMNERGYSRESILYKWENQVERGFQEYLEPYRKMAHTMVDNNHSMESELDKLISNFQLAD